MRKRHPKATPLSVGAWISLAFIVAAAGLLVVDWVYLTRQMFWYCLIVIVGESLYLAWEVGRARKRTRAAV